MATAEDVRRIAMALPGTQAVQHFGALSFKLGKIYAVLREPGKVTVGLEPHDQENLTIAHPEVVTRLSGKSGAMGWSYVEFAGCDEDLLAMLLRLAWSGAAPKRRRA